jgi:soluble lytic murein transglycosylase-like protein
MRVVKICAFAMVLIGAGIIAAQTTQVDAAPADTSYLHLRTLLGLAGPRDEPLELQHALRDAQEAYIRTLDNRLERAALRAYIRRINPLARVNEIADTIETCAHRNGVQLQLVLAVMQQESHFDDRAVGRHGERGLMQLTFSTARELGVRWDKAFDINTNVCAGAQYLANLVTRFGTPELAAQYYNGGGDPLYVKRVSRNLLRIAREFPRDELAPQQPTILATLTRNEMAVTDMWDEN